MSSKADIYSKSKLKGIRCDKWKLSAQMAETPPIFLLYVDHTVDREPGW